MEVRYDMDNRVLIVDDEPTSLLLLGKHLELAGYEVLKAIDSAESARDERRP